MLQVEVLVGELGTVDGLATGTVAGSEVTTLEHKVGDDTVERGALVTKALLTRGESTEVGGGLGDNAGVRYQGKKKYLLVKELELDGAKGGAVLGNVEENVGHVERSGCEATGNRGREGHLSD